jgi:hypothetical protein
VSRIEAYSSINKAIDFDSVSIGEYNKLIAIVGSHAVVMNIIFEAFA